MIESSSTGSSRRWCWARPHANIADSTCSATTLRRRRDEWVAAGVFGRLEQIWWDAYNQIVGLDLADVTVDGCIVKAPCGGEVAGKSPVDQGKQGTVHLDADYNSQVTRELLYELSCERVISIKGFPLQPGRRWVAERTDSWHNRGFRKLAICTERRARVIDALIALANAIIISRRLIRQAWTTHRWNTRPHRCP